MLDFIIRAMQLGFSASISPGPLQSYLISSALTLGWRRSLILCLVPIITDIPLIILVVFILGTVPDVMIRVLQIAGGFFLLWIAWGTFQSWRSGVTIGGSEDASLRSTSQFSVLRRGVLMGWISPSPYIYWGTVLGPLLIAALRESLLHAAAFLVSFYATFAFFIAVTIIVFDRLRRLDPRFTRFLILLTIIVLLWVAITLLLSGFGITS
ncbi:MAG: LysE family transporter [Anaerolineae bacterium]|nr:LysE family transporter [Anaerolineae bacterium]